MLRITNGKQILTVPKGAFKELYFPSGWVVVDDTPIMPPQGPTVPSGEGGDSNHTPKPENPSNGPYMASGEDNIQEEENTLQNMSEIELKQYASLLGIRTKNLKTREELMEAIKTHQE